MRKTLQRKFIVTAMAAISILILVLLGTINVGNVWMTGGQTERTLAMLSETEENFPPQMDLREKERAGFLAPPMNEDTAMSARYFLVRADMDGKIVYKDVGKIASVTEAEAGEFAQKVIDLGKKSGRIQQFAYSVTDSRDGRGTVMVFLDISNQFYGVLRILVISVAIGVLCWICMLFIVILLSKRAILPIARNMEKQKQFVTNAGHEIKTPLAIILANTEAMELHNGESKWSRNIREQTLRLNGLMQNLLTLAKMDESVGKVAATDFSASELLEETLEPFYEAASLKKISIAKDIQPDVKIHASSEQLRQLYSILLDNAVKYTEEGGRIEVSLRKRERKMLFRVENTCENLPKGNPEQLFDRFYRGNDARTQKSGGYGIGLSAARAIVEAQNGLIEASYKGKNIIEFTVRL